MSIDMQNFTGALEDPAAGGQEIGQNSYQAEMQSEDVHVYKELLTPESDSPVKDVIPEVNVASQEPTKQELNFQALREEVDRLKAEREAERQEFRQNLELLKANTQTQQRQEPIQEKKFLEEMSDNDVPNVAEIRRALEQRESAYQSRIEEMEVAQANPDYYEVLEKHTTPLLKQKPHLAQGIRGADNKALFAYELGKMAQKLHAPQPEPAKQSATAQRIVENARKPSTLAQAGGQSVLSQADYYATMSDAEFMKIATKNLGEI